MQTTTQISQSYEEVLLEDLQDPVEAANYLWAILEEWELDSVLLQRLLLQAIARVVLAYERAGLLSVEGDRQHQGFQKLAEASGVEVVYALVRLLDALGLTISIQPKE